MPSKLIGLDEMKEAFPQLQGATQRESSGMGLLTMDKVLEAHRKVTEVTKVKARELEFLNENIAKLQEQMVKQYVVYGQSQAIVSRTGFTPIKIDGLARDEDEDEVDEVDEELDRPTLADRLDKAEERIRELEGNLRDARIIAECADSEKRTAWKCTAGWQDRANRAEAMAQKLDLVVADLEKCRRDMGERRFKEVVGE